MTDGLYIISIHMVGVAYTHMHLYSICVYVYNVYASASLVCARVCIHIHEIMRSDGLVSLGEVGRGGVETFFQSLKQYDTATRLHLACVYSPLCRSRSDVADCCSCRRRKYKNPWCECVARVAFVSCLHCSEIWLGRGFCIICIIKKYTIIFLFIPRAVYAHQRVVKIVFYIYAVVVAYNVNYIITLYVYISYSAYTCGVAGP